MPKNLAPQLSDIVDAQNRIAGYVHRSPLLTCATLDEMTGAQLYFKCENFQKVGAFKFRGACNAVFSLPDEEAKNGVATHSSGNHAQALALAAKLRGIPAYIVMPENSPAVKKSAVAGYGGKIIFCEATLAAREAALQRVLRETGSALVHPYDDFRVIAGQGTATLELLEDVSDLDALLAPVGGGGLLSGTAIAGKGRRPALKIFGAEPALADDAFRSLRDRKLYPTTNALTVADGLRASLSERTFAVFCQLVDQIFTVEEEGIKQAMRLLWKRMKIVAEASAAVPLAALLAHKEEIRGKKIGVIISGGNVDFGT